METSNDRNNNNSESNDKHIDEITSANVEEELGKLKIIDDYDSDEYTHDKVCLSGTGIDLRALKAGQDIEFSLDDFQPVDNDDETTRPIDYESIFRYRNLEMCGADDAEDEQNPTDSKTPFEILKLKMNDITPNKDNGVFKRLLQQGVGSSIEKGSSVRIHYNAYFEMNDEPFDSTFLRNKTFEFKLGANEVVRGLDIAVGSMKKKEKSQFIFEPDYYCGKYGCEPRVPRNTPVLFEIEVISVLDISALDEYKFSCEDERHKMPFQKILQICNCLRELGNDNFARQVYHEATDKYKKAIYLMENKSAKNEEEDKKMIQILLKLYLNMSQVSLKLNKPKKTIFYCKLALNIDKKNPKALYRYGKALRTLQDFDKSRFYLKQALDLQPTNNDIIREIGRLNDMVSKFKLLEKSMCTRMFNSDEILKNKNEKTIAKLNKNNTPTVIRNVNQEVVVKQESELILNSNDEEKDTVDKKPLNHATKEFITNKLKEFIADKDSHVHKIPIDLYPQDMINYLIEQSNKLGLSTRIIKANENILQILKNF